MDIPIKCNKSSLTICGDIKYEKNYFKSLKEYVIVFASFIKLHVSYSWQYCYLMVIACDVTLHGLNLKNKLWRNY